VFAAAIAAGGCAAHAPVRTPTRIRNLVGEPKAEAERMLRRGLSACSTFAVSAIAGAGWRDLVPDLARAVAADEPEFAHTSSWRSGSSGTAPTSPTSSSLS